MFFFRAFIVISMAALVLLSPLESYARPTGQIEEIIVTAQKREQSIDDVNIAISAFSGDQLNQLGVVDTKDLEKIVAGFNYGNRGFNVPVFTVRGIGLYENSHTSSGTVGLYVDSFNLPFPVMTNGPQLDLSRVEILKGPQGTLFGRNSTAGAVNYVTEKPTETLESGIRGSYGRFETYDIEGFVSGPTFFDLDMRLAYRHIESNEGWQKSLTRPNGPEDELGKKDKSSARYTVQWLEGDRTEVLFSVDWWEDNSEPQAQAPLLIRAQNPVVGDAALDPSIANHPTVPFDSDDMRIASWPSQTEHGFKWQINDDFLMGRIRIDRLLGETSKLTYLGSHGNFNSDGSSLPQSGLSAPNVEAILYIDTQVYSNEMQFSSTWGANFDYLVGVFQSHDEVGFTWDALTETSSVFFPVDGQSTIADRILSIAQQEADVEALYFNTEWHFVQKFKLTVGGRYNREERDFSGCVVSSEEGNAPIGLHTLFNALSVSQGGSGGAGPGDCVTLDKDTQDPTLFEGSLDESNVSWKFALDWTPSESSLYYLSVTRGFKSGSFPITQSATTEQYRPVTQERLDSFEIGGKLKLWGNRAKINFAAFYYDYRDKQLLSTVDDPVFGPLPILDNAPKSEVRGGELEVRLIPLANLDISISAAYLDSEVTEFVGVDENGEAEDFSGNEFNFTPNWNVVATIDYSVPIKELFKIKFGVNYGYTGATNSVLSENPLFALESYENVDYRVGVASIDEKWNVSFWGRNVTNEYQPISVTNLADAITRFSGMPQTYGLSFEYNLIP